jgi:hypothetical protein
MRALKLVQHMKANAGRMSEVVTQKIRNSERCRELVLKVSAEEHKRYSMQIYRDLTDWLDTETDSTVKERYIELGVQRAKQGVPFTNLYWAVCIAHEHLWEYMQQECLLDEPVEFWGGVTLLRSLTQFFDQALYFTLVGYEKTARGEPLSAATVSQHR